jgi:hypothetical protein
MINQDTPDNTKLISLLNAWSQKISKKTFAAVRTELMKGNSFLMLPSGATDVQGPGWHTYEKSPRLELRSVYTMDGIQVLGAFTDIESLLRWSNGRAMNYTSLRSQEVLDICVRYGFKRVVINSGSDNIYPLSYYTTEEMGTIKGYW